MDIPEPPELSFQLLKNLLKWIFGLLYSQKLQKSNIDIPCPFCGGKPMIFSRTLFPPISKFLSGYTVADVICRKCRETLYLSEKEREMKHKELIEIFRVIIAGGISFSVAAVVYAFDRQQNVNPIQIGGLALLFVVILLVVFNSASEKIRTDIRIIQALEKKRRTE